MNSKSKYHIYGDYYQWTTNKKAGIKLARKYHGVLTKETNGKEVVVTDQYKGAINEY
jgi:hypothetical protein